MLISDEDVELIRSTRARYLRLYVFVGTTYHATRRGVTYATLRGKTAVKGRWQHITDIPLSMKG